jgi:CheY-like chemotaxis protein
MNTVPHNRLDFFDHGDRTALVCLDVPEIQRMVVEQLTELGYKIHTGLFIEDILLKLRAHAYDVVIVSEHFDATDTATNPIIATAIDAPPAQRRKQFIAVLGSSFTTGDEMQAFTASVDLVIALADVVNLRPILRRGVNRAQEFYAPLHDAMRAAGVA